jgi:hypothetical protein
MQVLEINKQNHQIISHSNKRTYFGMTTKKNLYLHKSDSFAESTLLEGSGRIEQRFVLSQYDPLKMEVKPGYHKNFIENTNLYDFKNFCGYFIKLNYMYSCSPVNYYLFQEKNYSIIKYFASPVLPIQIYEDVTLFNLLQKNNDFLINKKILLTYLDQRESLMKTDFTPQLGNLLVLKKN